jgi:hypothetical protein
MTVVSPDADRAASSVGSRHQPPHLVAHQFGADLRCF